MPLMSVLLPCRDAAQFLPECIASLQAQTYDRFEVCAVDDGSSDETVEILNAWSARDARVRVIRRPRYGLIAALRAAANAARGELLVRMDADDVAVPVRFERQVEWLTRRPEIAACGTGIEYFPQEVVREGAMRYAEWLNTLSDPAEVARNIFVECPIAHPTLMIWRDAFEHVGGYADVDWPEDYDLVLRLFTAGFPLGKVPEVLHFWRERGERTSRVDPRYSPHAFRRCKVHYLRQTFLRGGREAVVWGAGRVGKYFARELIAQGVELRAFIDIDPRKIGQTVYGVPVLAIEELGTPGAAYVLAAVGSPGAREDIRGRLVHRGFVELRDFCAAA